MKHKRQFTIENSKLTENFEVDKCHMDDNVSKCLAHSCCNNKKNNQEFINDIDTDSSTIYDEVT